MSFCIILYCNIAVKVLFCTQVPVSYEILSKAFAFWATVSKYSKKPIMYP